MSDTPRIDPALVAGNRRPLAGYQAQHVAWSLSDGIATITLNRPERKNPLTFDSYAELRDLFERLRHASDVKVVVLAGAGDNFCSGGDVHEIIGPLVTAEGARAADVHAHDRRPGEGDARLPAADRRRDRRRLRRRRRDHGDGVATCASARRARRPRSCSTASASPAATWARARCCRGSSARAAPASCSTPAAPSAARRASAGASSTGWSSRRASPARRWRWRKDLAAGPTFANGITKTMLHQEWAMTIEQAIEAEAQAQAICMLTEDFTRAYEAFVAKQKPRFEGN